MLELLVLMGRAIALAFRRHQELILENIVALFTDILGFCARVVAIQFGQARSMDER